MAEKDGFIEAAQQQRKPETPTDGGSTPATSSSTPSTSLPPQNGADGRRASLSKAIPPISGCGSVGVWVILLLMTSGSVAIAAYAVALHSRSVFGFAIGIDGSCDNRHRARRFRLRHSCPTKAGKVPLVIRTEKTGSKPPIHVTSSSSIQGVPWTDDPETERGLRSSQTSANPVRPSPCRTCDSSALLDRD